MLLKKYLTGPPQADYSNESISQPLKCKNLKWKTVQSSREGKEML
jgi:hypothetical protein